MLPKCKTFEGNCCVPMIEACRLDRVTLQTHVPATPRKKSGSINVKLSALACKDDARRMEVMRKNKSAGDARSHFEKVS